MPPVCQARFLTTGTLVAGLAILAGCAPAPEKGSQSSATPAFESMQMKGVEPVTLTVDADAAARRLAKSVTFATISNQDRKDFDAKAYEGLHRFLKETFPLTHKTLKLETVGDPRAHTLVYEWTGKDPSKAPIVLMAHQDVVPVVPGTESQWTHGAFSGDIADGYVWGRGTLDDKLPMMAILEAVEMQLKASFQPTRTTFLVFGQDEEVMGPEGVAKVPAVLQKRGLKEVAFLLDEGLPLTTGLFPGVDAPTALIAIAEKGYLTLELKVEGTGGHSAAPGDESTIGVLAKAVTKLEAAPFPYRITPAVRAQFRYLGPELPKAQQALYAGVAFGETTPNPQADEEFTKSMAATPPSRASLHTTTAVTMFNAGVKENVLPPSATALVNFRILQGDTVQSVTEAVKKIIDDPQVKVSQAGAAVDPSPVSRIDGQEYGLLEKTIRQTWSEPGLLIAPYLMVGGTDSKYFSAALAKNVYRFTPVRVESVKDTERWHGVNERVLVAEYARSIGFYHQLLLNVEGL